MHLRRVLSALACVLLFAREAQACPACFQGASSPLIDSARLGVLAMAVVAVLVLGALAAWFVRLGRLERLENQQ